MVLQVLCLPDLIPWIYLSLPVYNCKGFRSYPNWASLVAQLVRNLPAMRETWVWSLGWEDPLEKGKDYSLQCSGLEKSMNCTVNRFAKSQTWLSDFHFHFLNTLVVFPTFFNLSLNVAIRCSRWATVNYQSYFYWLYRASPSSTANIIINLILVLVIGDAHVYIFPSMRIWLKDWESPGKQTLGGHKQNLVCTRIQEKGTVTPQMRFGGLQYQPFSGIHYF